MLKEKIRKKLLKIRKNKYKKNLKVNSSAIINILLKKNLKNLVIGGYYPINYEINDLNILKEFEKKNYKISLPVVKNNKQMDFYLWSFKKALKVNKYGIPEPYKHKLVYPNILLVPLVAFDSKRFRLGYGGGFYDRYISKMKNKKYFFTIGLAFDFQKVKKIPKNKYDKKIDIIVTNKKIYK